MRIVVQLLLSVGHYQVSTGYSNVNKILTKLDIMNLFRLYKCNPFFNPRNMLTMLPV